jgi:hypothetical protein
VRGESRSPSAKGGGGRRTACGSTHRLAGMRAVQITRFGGPEVLEIVDVPEPTPGDGQQLYDVSTAGVNYADTHQIVSSEVHRGARGGALRLSGQPHDRSGEPCARMALRRAVSPGREGRVRPGVAGCRTPP